MFFQNFRILRILCFFRISEFFSFRCFLRGAWFEYVKIGACSEILTLILRGKLKSGA